MAVAVVLVISDECAGDAQL